MRKATVIRETHETKIELALNLDPPLAETAGFANHLNGTAGIGFFDHMLTALVFRAGIAVDLKCQGDLHVDDHHTVEDVGVVLGMAFAEALGDKAGIMRFGQSSMPMDEALANCAIDISGRGFLVFNADMPTPVVGSFSTEMVEEFFRAFAVKAGITLHINLAYGKNTHHIIEAIFKSVGAALNQAIQIKGTGVPSTKGVL